MKKYKENKYMENKYMEDNYDNVLNKIIPELKKFIKNYKKIIFNNCFLIKFEFCCRLFIGEFYFDDGNRIQFFKDTKVFPDDRKPMLIEISNNIKPFLPEIDFEGFDSYSFAYELVRKDLYINSLTNNFSQLSNISYSNKINGQILKNLPTDKQLTIFLNLEKFLKWNNHGKIKLKSLFKKLNDENKVYLVLNDNEYAKYMR